MKWKITRPGSVITDVIPLNLATPIAENTINLDLQLLDSPTRITTQLVRELFMSKAWFLRKNGKTYGPMSPEKLKTASLAGKITAQDEVSISKDGPWHSVTKLKGLTFKPVKSGSKPGGTPARTFERTPPPLQPPASVAVIPTPQQTQAAAPLPHANYVNPPVQQLSPGADTRALLQYQAHAKSAGLAFAFWFFLGMWGAHRFYCGKTALVLQCF